MAGVITAPDQTRFDAGCCGDAAPEGGCLSCEVRPISICGALGTAELVELETMSERRSFAAREPIALQGDPAEVVYNVTGGAVRVYKLLSDGRRQIVGFLLPGDFLGLTKAERFSVCADAVRPATACCFRRTAFQGFLDRKPHLLRRLHEAAASELTLAQDHMVLLGRRTAEERVLAFLLSLRTRWARICGKASVTVPIPMGRADIGDHLGLTIETVSRTLNQLARRRLLLIVPDGVRFLDLDAAERLAAA